MRPKVEAQKFIETPETVATDIGAIRLNEQGDVVQSTDNGAVSTWDPPWILHIPAEQFSSKCPDLSTEAGSLEKRFKQDACRTTAGRSQRRVSDKATMQFGEAAMLGFTKSMRILKDDLIPDSLKAELCTALFAVARSKQTLSAEAGHLPSLRLGITGLR